MIVSPLWRGKRYAVLGLARSGAATVRALVAAGAEVVAWDSDAAKRAALAAAFPGEGRGPVGQADVSTDGGSSFQPSQLDPGLRQGTVTFEDVEQIDLSAFDALIVSPGVPLNRHPIAAKARAAGIPIIGDIELFAQARASLPPHKLVGVTGTNGKSTTVTLIHHILETAGIPLRLGGNIGLPILEQEPLPEGGVYVLELSSYQIDLTQTLDCDVAVLLNITPDHLDRYGSLAAYAASKARLFEMQTSDHVAFVNWDNFMAQQVAPVANFNGLVLPDWADQAEWQSLKGPHNAENAAAAISACSVLGVSDETIRQGLRTFKGLPHRMERIATINGVPYINDSKATNPESTAPALAAFEGIHWILGGQAKSDNLDACAPYFGNVMQAYTIGEAGPRFAAILKGKFPVVESGTLDKAVSSAAANARLHETVLLSPACASFDQFRDFEDRGDRFRALVEALA